MSYIHVCTAQCFCPVCGMHKVSKPSVHLLDSCELYAGCPDGHMIEKIGEVFYNSSFGTYAGMVFVQGPKV